jgi:DNA-binding response OmpR family regulator
VSILTKVLIIEDDNIIGEMLSLYLTEEDFNVQRVATGQEGIAALSDFVPDLILLDLLLPDYEGTKLCTTLRKQTQVPFIVISMKSAVNEKIEALNAGADDFLSKPFSMQELKARIYAQIRRAQTHSLVTLQPVPEVAEKERTEKHLQLDLDRRTLQLNGQLVETTYSEFEIIKLFCNYPGKVFSREELINALRGIDSFVNERSIDVHVTNLRKKIEKNPKEPTFIKTVWGVGYKFLA